MRGDPATFPLNGVIPGWTEGVQLMVEGEKTRFWIPEKLAYHGQPGAPAGMLVFDIELISIAALSQGRGAARSRPAPRRDSPATTDPDRPRVRGAHAHRPRAAVRHPR